MGVKRGFREGQCSGANRMHIGSRSLPMFVKTKEKKKNSRFRNKRKAKKRKVIDRKADL